MNGNKIRMIPIASLQLHEAADVVPRMRPDELTAFLADVKERGIQEPLVAVAKGSGFTVLDGRHRLDAAKECQLRSVPVRVIKLSGKEQTEWLMRAAVLRRHLSDDQRAVLARRFQGPLSKAAVDEKLAKARAVKAGSMSDDVDRHRKTDTRTEVAKAFNVSERKVREAAFVDAHSPELAEQVLAGTMPLKQAKRAVEREPGDDTDAIKRDRERHRNNGREVVSTKARKNARHAFGVIVRFLSTHKRLDEFRPCLEKICAIVEGRA